MVYFFQINYTYTNFTPYFILYITYIYINVLAFSKTALNDFDEITFLYVCGVQEIYWWRSNFRENLFKGNNGAHNKIK